MRKLMMLAPVVALALVSANCSGGAFNSPTGPGLGVTDSATEARGGGGGGKKPGGGGSTGGGGSLAVAMVNDVNGDGAPNWGETITFIVTTSDPKPFVRLNCYQNSTLVYSGSVGFFPDYPWAKEFYLVSGGWSGGAANCTATMYTTLDGSSTTTLATLNFSAGA